MMIGSSGSVTVGGATGIRLLVRTTSALTPSTSGQTAAAAKPTTVIPSGSGCRRLFVQNGWSMHVADTYYFDVIIFLELVYLDD